MTRELNRVYNAIVMDCGVLNEHVQEDFSAADIRILCGSAMPYELAGFYRAIERCKGFPIQPIGLFVPDDTKPYLTNNIRNDILFGDISHDLFTSTGNSSLFQILLEEYFH
ncbi:hypothetical protein D3C73_1340700 [compost metagenome]